MVNPDPLEPGHSPRQNPNTPERMPGHTSDDDGFSRPRLFYILAPVVLIVAALLVYFSLDGVDPRSVPHSEAEQSEGKK